MASETTGIREIERRVKEPGKKVGLREISRSRFRLPGGVEEEKRKQNQEARLNAMKEVQVPLGVGTNKISKRKMMECK